MEFLNNDFFKQTIFTDTLNIPSVQDECLSPGKKRKFSNENMGSKSPLEEFNTLSLFTTDFSLGNGDNNINKMSNHTFTTSSTPHIVPQITIDASDFIENEQFNMFDESPKEILPTSNNFETNHSFSHQLKQENEAKFFQQRQMNLEPTFTLDISPKTRVSNNPKDISITVSIKIPALKLRQMYGNQNIPEQILLWSSSVKLQEKVLAISTDGFEIEVNTSNCFVVLMDFEMKDKDEKYLGPCGGHLAKEKEGCPFANFPGPSLFRHVSPLTLNKRVIGMGATSTEAVVLQTTFNNVKIDKKGHFCKSSKFKLYLSSKLQFPLSLQLAGLVCDQHVSTVINYSKHVVTDGYWLEKLMESCPTAELRFFCQRINFLYINSPKLPEDLANLIPAFSHLAELDIRWVNPFVNTNFVLQLLSKLFEKCSHLKVLTLQGPQSSWRQNPIYWNWIQKLEARLWDLNIAFYEPDNVPAALFDVNN